MMLASLFGLYFTEVLLFTILDFAAIFFVNVSFDY